VLGRFFVRLEGWVQTAITAIVAGSVELMSGSFPAVTGTGLAMDVAHRSKRLKRTRRRSFGYWTVLLKAAVSTTSGSPRKNFSGPFRLSFPISPERLVDVYLRACTAGASSRTALVSAALFGDGV
jgi:hypothetical protein